MRDEAALPSVADANIPSAGRINNFLLGGSRNFQVDRKAARLLLTDVPEMGQWVRLIRWFYDETARRLTDDGFRAFIDFGSGLIETGCLHEQVPPDSTVIYSDADPAAVAYGEKALGGLAKVRYLLADARHPRTLLDQESLSELIDFDRPVAISFNGLAWFFDDEVLRLALRDLHAWAPSGSRLFLSDTDTVRDSTKNQRIQSFYQTIGQPIHVRTAEKLATLFGEWTICAPGIQPLDLGIGGSTEDSPAAGADGRLVGVLLEKR